MKNAFFRTILHLQVILLLCNSCKEAEKKEELKDTWYRNAVIYNVEVATFKDSNNDGIGDFNGLRQKLNYLDSLGVNVIWLAPFQPSPRKDDGYDVSDYFSIDTLLGTMDDFNLFMQEAKSKKINVIMDAVLNHTSIDHPWYQSARSSRTSPYRSWYVWSDTQPKDWNEGMVFPGVQNQTWTFDEVANSYYFHRFYNFQPDLNYENPQVRAKAIEILSFWLKKGIKGFRLDAVPFIIDIPKSGSKKPEHMFHILTDIRKVVEQINPDAILLGEANVTAEENAEYFGDKGDRLHMMFNFFVNQHLFHSLATQDINSLTTALEDFRKKTASAQEDIFSKKS